MGRVYTDTERLMQASELSSNGHHNQAAAKYRDMANEQRKPSEKRSLWKAAEKSKGIG